MASYLGFHCNESVPVPHQLPTSLAQTHFWDKGILDGVPSVLNAYTSGTDDLEISQFSELHENLDDSDVIPSSQLPPSYHQWRSVHTPELCAPDPDLGLTPEKRMPFARGSVKADVKDKTERKVRFDVASSSESELEKSPDASMKGKSDASDETSCECLVESVGPSVQNSKQHEEMPKVYTYSLKSYPESALKDTQITDLETAVSTDGKKKRSKLNDMLLKFSKDDKSLVPDELCNDSLVRREQEEIPVVTEYNYPFKDVKEQESVVLFSSAFERPEYNSTLRLGNEMKDLASQRRDVAKAVRKTLEESDSLRTGINEKAASRVNTQGDVFQGLATLEVPISDIISQVERDQRSKIKHTSGKNKKDTKSKDLEEPDLMEFFTTNLQREHVDLSVTGVSFPKDSLSLAPHDKAFDMYKHNLAWEEFD